MLNETEHASEMSHVITWKQKCLKTLMSINSIYLRNDKQNP